MADFEKLFQRHRLPWRADPLGDGYIWDADNEIVASLGGMTTGNEVLAMLCDLFTAAPGMLNIARDLVAAQDRQDGHHLSAVADVTREARKLIANIGGKPKSTFRDPSLPWGAYLNTAGRPDYVKLARDAGYDGSPGGEAEWCKGNGIIEAEGDSNG